MFSTSWSKSDTPSQRWHDYFDPYFSKSKKQGKHVVDLLDQEWADGKQTVDLSLKPFMSASPVALEIGSGLGRVSRHLAPLCAHLTCCDISSRTISEMQKLMGPRPNISYQQIDGFTLRPLTDASFDLVCSFSTFFHLDFDVVVTYFQEIRRVLKPGGIAVLEFKRWVEPKNVDQLIQKIETSGGPAAYCAQLDKWRYLSADMLNLLCQHFELEVLHPDTTSYTFRRNS